MISLVTAKGVEVNVEERTRGGYKFGVYATNHYGKYPYVGFVIEQGQRKTKTWNANFEVYQQVPSDKKYDIIQVPVNSYKDFNMDDRVRVRNDINGAWEHRYFAKVVNNVPYCFCGGANSWSTDGKTIGWRFCEKIE